MSIVGIGQYRHVIAIANPGIPVSDGEGGYTEAWEPATPPTVYASIESASQRDLERITGGAVLTTATHLIRTRYHAGISTASRLTFRGRVFEVQSVQDVDERQIALLLICAEVVTRAVAPPGQTATAATVPPSHAPAPAAWE